MKDIVNGDENGAGAILWLELKSKTFLCLHCALSGGFLALNRNSDWDSDGNMGEEEVKLPRP